MATLIALPPCHDFIGPVGEREIAHEARAVKVGVGAFAEVHGGSLGNQAERVVKRHLAVDHAAEDHLVVAALRPAHAAHLPSLGEGGHAFLVPAGRCRAW